MKRACPLHPGAPVWAYFRDSGGEAQERSVAQQLDEAERYAQQHGLLLARTFTDESRPGGTTVGRDALDRMLVDARHLATDRRNRQAQAPAGVLFWDTRRLGRDQLDNAFIKADLRRRGYTLIFLADDVPDVGDFTPVVEAFLDWKAEQDLRDIGRDAQRGLRALARQGYHPGGKPPLGYRSVRVLTGTKRNGQPRYGARWEIDPQKAFYVRLCWEMRAAGESLQRIHDATRLYKDRGCYSSMFRNRTYLGILKCGSLEIENAHPALCTPEQWAAVQARNGRRQPIAPWGSASPYLLTGLVYCGFCGAACSGSSDNRNTRYQVWPYYVCGRQKREGWSTCRLGKVGADRLEESVVATLHDTILQAPHMRKLLDQVAREYEEEHIDQQLLEGRAHVREVETAIEGLLFAVENNPSRSVMLRLAERETERDLALATLAELEARSGVEQSLHLDDQALEALITELRAGLVGDPDTVRETIRRLIARIDIRQNEGSLTLRLPLRSFLSLPPKGLPALDRVRFLILPCARSRRGQ